MKKAKSTENKPSDSVPSRGGLMDAKRRLEAHELESANFKAGPYKRPGKKIGRNAKCPCGSGKKYKNCHINGRKPLNTKK